MEKSSTLTAISFARRRACLSPLVSQNMLRWQFVRRSVPQMAYPTRGLSMTALLQRVPSGWRFFVVLALIVIGACAVPLAGQQIEPPPANRDLVKPGDWLKIQVDGTLPQAPIEGPYQVEASGKLPLGLHYGRVRVHGETLEQAEAIVLEHLAFTCGPEVTDHPLRSSASAHTFGDPGAGASHRQTGNGSTAPAIGCCHEICHPTGIDVGRQSLVRRPHRWRNLQVVLAHAR